MLDSWASVGPVETLSFTYFLNVRGKYFSKHVFEGYNSKNVSMICTYNGVKKI